jgi:carbonic anhydrase
MSVPYDQIFENNRQWVAQRTANDPHFFENLARDQRPGWLWIGCADSRVPANEITGLEPGDLFVHRNIANLVPNTDLNSQSVIQYAVGALGVENVVVCGHYGCGGVKAAMQAQDLGLLNPWLRNIRDVFRLHAAELHAIEDQTARTNRLVELNVLEQCRNVLKLAVVQQRYLKDGFPKVHGWVYDLHDGLLKDLKVDSEALLREIRDIYALTPE